MGAGQVKVAVAVSGGGDSLAALMRLRGEGHDVLALHCRFADQAADASAGLSSVCDGLGVPLRVLDLRAEFEARVIAPFAAEYLAGRTPNPCARCNAAMKFGLLLDRARELGAQALATGHYTHAGAHPAYGWALSRGADPVKDQSYFLSLVPRERLQAAVFPLAGALKSELRAAQTAEGVAPPLPEESQEVCFVPGDDYRTFLDSRCRDRLSGPGPAVLPGGTPVGEHQGLWRYTIGQRRGLGLAWREPLYVLDKDMAGNRLIVAPRRALEVDGFTASGLNALVDPALWPERLFVQTRYRERAKPACAVVAGDGIFVRFDSPQARPAPGQVAALYDTAGVVLAGAVVD
jgi:tRNA-specific 2-thiouridylase